jgi:hypothetical protein
MFDYKMPTDVSEEYVTSIFKQSWLCFLSTLISCLAYSSTLKMEKTYSSETSIGSLLTRRRYILKYRTLLNHRHENIKSYMF